MIGLPKIIRKNKPLEIQKEEVKQEVKEPIVMKPVTQQEEIQPQEQPQVNTLENVLMSFDERITNIERLLIKLTSEPNDKQSNG
jgi:hypothetical protein